MSGPLWQIHYLKTNAYQTRLGIQIHNEFNPCLIIQYSSFYLQYLYYFVVSREMNKHLRDEKDMRYQVCAVCCDRMYSLYY